MGRGRLLRFALESILYESLKATDFVQEGVPLDEDEDLPILPPVAYRAVEGLMKMSPEVLDTFSYDVQLSRLKRSSQKSTDGLSPTSISVGTP